MGGFVTDVLSAAEFSHYFNLGNRLCKDINNLNEIFTEDDELNFNALSAYPTIYGVIITGTNPLADAKEIALAEIFIACIYLLKIDLKNLFQLSSERRKKLIQIILDNKESELRASDGLGYDNDDLLAVIIRVLPCTKITTFNIDFKFKHLDYKIIYHLSLNSTLETLFLDQKDLDDVDIKILAKNNTTLKTLHLCANNLGEESALALAANKTLTKLNLFQNKTRKGAGAFAINSTLKELNVYHNEIDEETACLLAQNKTLTRLNIGLNPIGVGGVKALAANEILRELDVSVCHLDDEGAIALAANSTLEKLNLSYNKISEKGEEAFIDAAPDNYCIQYIIGLSSKTVNRLSPYWERNKKLKLREAIDSINIIIKEVNSNIDKKSERDISCKIDRLNTALKTISDLLNKFKNEKSDNAQHIIKLLQNQFKLCIDKKVQLFMELNNISDAIESKLEIPENHPDYYDARFNVFEQLYMNYVTHIKSKIASFCLALQACIEKDEKDNEISLLLIFNNNAMQKVFDGCLVRAAEDAKVKTKTTFSVSSEPLNHSSRLLLLDELLFNWQPEAKEQKKLRNQLLKLNKPTNDPLKNSVIKQIDQHIIALKDGWLFKSSNAKKHALLSLRADLVYSPSEYSVEKIIKNWPIYHKNNLATISEQRLRLYEYRFFRIVFAKKPESFKLVEKFIQNKGDLSPTKLAKS